jgi:ABC-2 type transport system ATP-binding protein
VLHGISLSLCRGEWLVLLGPNGSGKSTLLDCVAGRLLPRAGTVAIAGHDLAVAPRAARQCLGYAVAPERLPDVLTGWQCLEVHAAARGLRAIDGDVLRLAGALHVDRWLAQRVGMYSLGTRQKLSLLLALLGNPDLLVLDESLNGLDPASARTVKQHLHQRVAQGRAGVLLATHALDLLERHADRAALLVEGRLLRTWDSRGAGRLVCRHGAGSRPRSRGRWFGCR